MKEDLPKILKYLLTMILQWKIDFYWNSFIIKIFSNICTKITQVTLISFLNKSQNHKKTLRKSINQTKTTKISKENISKSTKKIIITHKNPNQKNHNKNMQYFIPISNQIFYKTISLNLSYFLIHKFILNLQTIVLYNYSYNFIQIIYKFVCNFTNNYKNKQTNPNTLNQSP